MGEEGNHFGLLMQAARESAGLSRKELAERVGLDASHVYRMEVGDRRPSREATLALAEALSVANYDVDFWLTAAGYAPMPLLAGVRSAMRTRGGRRRSDPDSARSSKWDAGRWASWLEAMGLQDAQIGQLLNALEMAGLSEQRAVTSAVSATFSQFTRMLESPVRTAVIPAAGGHHRVIAPHVMQQLLLRVISEAVDSGLSQIHLVLAPGAGESLFLPLREAFNLTIVPAIKLQYTEQIRPEGLGDAVLQAESLVGQEPFAVLLPDDVIQERIGRTLYPRELRRMMDAFSRLDNIHLAAVKAIPRSKMPHYGVVQVGAKEILPQIRLAIRLKEKPPAKDPICRASQTRGIVGRYLFCPDIFAALRQLKDKHTGKGRTVELTDALELIRQNGQDRRRVYTFELASARQDVGKVIEEASDLIGDFSKPQFASRVAK